MDRIVLMNDGRNLFTAETLTAVTISTTFIVTRCLKSLFEKGILVKNGKYIIQDLVLRKCLALNV